MLISPSQANAKSADNLLVSLLFMFLRHYWFRFPIKFWLYLQWNIVHEPRVVLELTVKINQKKMFSINFVPVVVLCFMNTSEQARSFDKLLPYFYDQASVNFPLMKSELLSHIVFFTKLLMPASSSAAGSLNVTSRHKQ